MPGSLNARPKPGKTGIDRRRRFELGGEAGLDERERSGKQPQDGRPFSQRGVSTPEQTLEKGQSAWEAPDLAKHLIASAHSICRAPGKEGCLPRGSQRSWCISPDPEIQARAAEIVRVNLNPPENAFRPQADEKPGIQGLERRTGYVRNRQSKDCPGSQQRR